MRLALIGASGFVGSQLVKRLKDHSTELVLVGRSPDRLERQFPGLPVYPMEELEKAVSGAAAVLYLAVLNNNVNASEEEFFHVNAALLKDAALKARNAGVPVFVNFCSYHALPDGPGTPYAQSKRAGCRALEGIDGLQVLNLMLPAVHGEDFSGKLALLKRVPNVLRPTALTLMSSFSPTVHIGRIVDFLLVNLAKQDSSETIFLFDDKDENPVYRALRAAIDFGFALSVIVLFWWLLIILWVAVRMGSEGPGIFAQDRIGKNGKVFTCYKFRTMKAGTRQAGTHEISGASVTPIGAFLRRTKLDELPQVWNILKRDLSLVGPRPCLPSQNDLIEERRRRGVLRVLPGITGLAQVQGIDMSDPVRLGKKDAEYVARRGLLLDLKIILATFTGKGRGDRVAG